MVARSQAIRGLDPKASLRASLPGVFGVRIAELWAWARYMNDPQRVRELHDMRIAAKRLRYCFEFYTPCFGKDLKAPLERFKKLQDYLGEIHDCDVWADRLRMQLRENFRDLRRLGKSLDSWPGALPECGRAARDLRAALASPAARGLLAMINEVCKRRELLYRELKAYWTELEQSNFRAELVGIVVKGAARDIKRGVSAPAFPGLDAPLVKAALDIGSNSIKLLVLELDPNDGYRTLLDLSTVTGLGRGLSQGAELDPQAVADSLAALRTMVAHARELGASEIVAAGTAALRTCSNPQALLAPLREDLQVEARVLSGDEEAQISQRAALEALSTLAPGMAHAVFFDLGGGSLEITEMSLQDGQMPRALRSVSLAAGARRLTEMAAIKHPVRADTKARLRALIEELLAKAPAIPSRPLLAAGLGGTASVLVWLEQGMRGLPATDPHGAWISREWLDGLLGKLEKMKIEEILELPNLDPQRAGIVYAGASVIAAVLEKYGCEGFRLIDRGLRYGLLVG